MPDDSAIETVYRSCPTCEASCGLVMEVDRDNKKVISVKGDPDDAMSRGYVCAKSQAFRYVYEDPERVTRPLRKVAGGWEEISWDEALNEVGERLSAIKDDHGKDAIAMYYGNPNGHNFHTQIYTELFISMLNTERFFSAGSVDQQPKNLVCELLYGNAWMFPVPDIGRSDFLVCMGGNPLVSQGSLLGAPDVKQYFRDLQDRGGQLVVIDPRRTETADIANHHLFIRPGSDAFFLFAWVNELFATDKVELGRLEPFIDGVEAVRQMAQPFTPERVAAVTGVPAASLRTLVKNFSAASAPALYGRIGLCTQEFGTLASWLVEVVNILTGRLDEIGGAMFGRPATGQHEQTGQVEPIKYGRWHSRARGFPEYMNMLPASFMAEELECEGADKVRAMITVAGNPVLSVPNGKRVGQALENIEFMVALDIYINETTANADIILPSTVQLEHSNYDFLFAGFAQRNYVHYSPQVFTPQPDSKGQYQLLLEISARMNGMNAEDLNAMMLDGMIAHITATPELSHLNAEFIKDKTSAYEDGERLLDIMLRVGPYGDKFEDDNPGLSLAKVKQQQHGIDMGPLQSVMPDLLRTEGQRLRLVHEILQADMPRLLTALDCEPAAMVLIGRRHIRDMNSWLHNIDQYARGKNRCTLMINPADASRIGLRDGGEAKVSSRVGELRVEVAVTDEIMPGVVSLPHGFGHQNKDARQSIAAAKTPGVSANDLVDDEVLDIPSGTSVVNGVPVQVMVA